MVQVERHEVTVRLLPGLSHMASGHSCVGFCSARLWSLLSVRLMIARKIFPELCTLPTWTALSEGIYFPAATPFQASDQDLRLAIISRGIVPRILARPAPAYSAAAESNLPVART